MTTQNGSPEYGRYIVGCQFVGTLHPSALPAELEPTLGEWPGVGDGVTPESTAMLAHEIKNLVGRVFKHEVWFGFRAIDDSTFAVLLPGERLPAVGIRDVRRELSADTAVGGPALRAVLMRGLYNGQRVKLLLQSEAAGN